VGEPEETPRSAGELAPMEVCDSTGWPAEGPNKGTVAELESPFCSSKLPMECFDYLLYAFHIDIMQCNFTLVVGYHN